MTTTLIVAAAVVAAVVAVNARRRLASDVTNHPGGSNGRRRPGITLVIAGSLLAASLAVVATVGAPQAAEAVAYIEEPNWQDGKIAFSVSWSQSKLDLGRVNADGSDSGGIGGSWWQEGNPSWSPSGAKLAFTFFDAFVGGDNVGIAIVNSDGTNLKEVLKNNKPAGKATWSPDGLWLAFTMSDTSGTSLYKMKTGGTQLTQILGPNVYGPHWSPDGTTIALARQLPPDNSWQIVLIDPNGTALGTLTTVNTQFVEARDPVWSPDGTKIAFTGEAPDGTKGIWVMNADGSGATQFTNDGSGPEWAPNGALILFTRGGNPYVVPSTGGAAMMLPHWGWEVTPRHVIGFDWQPVHQPWSPKHTTGLVDPASGKWHLYDEAGMLTTSFYYGNPGDYPFMGDWNGDGNETPGLYRQSDGYVYLRNSNTQGPADVNFFFGNPGDVPIAGDFNGDGYDTVSIYRPSNQRFYIINELGSNDGGLGAADVDYVFGDPGDKPFVGDFDGDGEETVGLHRESTGLVYFRNSHSQGNADNQFIFGDPGDRLIAGDWTGDGTFTPALYRPSDTTMYFRYTNTQGNADNEHIPVTTDANWLPVSGHTGK